MEEGSFSPLPRKVYLPQWHLHARATTFDVVEHVSERAIRHAPEPIPTFLVLLLWHDDHIVVV
jgi:hypothetical protein